MFRNTSIRLSAVSRNQSHVVWVLIQHVLVKGFFAAKFLLAARMLGPEQFGLVGVALAALAIIESLSDTGMTQALIQRAKLVTKVEAGAVWTLQLIRGLALLIVLYLFSAPIADLFGIADSAPLIALAALLPLVRNALNPGYAVLQRNRQFRALAFSESAVSFVDFAATCAFLYGGMGAMAVLLGSLVADVSRFALSWLTFRMPIKANFGWSAIQDLGRYGRWVWGSSVLVVILNQFDKIMVSRWLGATQFGLYQTSTRLAQMAVSEVANALSAYLFPTLANLHQDKTKNAKHAFIAVAKKVGLACGAMAMGAALIGPVLLLKILGPQWASMEVILQIQCLTMWFSGMNSLCVAYLRAIGQPNAVFMAIFIQLAILIIPAYWVIVNLGAVGMAGLMAAALCISFFVMLFQIYRK